METKEKILVFAHIVNGKTDCVCHASHKECQCDCEQVLLERDRYKGWQGTMKRGRYGK